MCKNGSFTSALPPLEGKQEVKGDVSCIYIIAQHSADSKKKLMEGAVMPNRIYYEKLFSAYPDLVPMKDYRKMLGGVTEAKALRLLEQGHIKFFLVHRRHMIPKVCIIDYLLGISHSTMAAGTVQQSKSKRRKPGTGCLYQINDHLWEGKYSPRNAYGKRISKNVYAKTKVACEKKLSALIAQMDKEICAQRVKLMEEKYAEDYIAKAVVMG